MKTALLWCPFCDPGAPPAALALLAACLRQAKHEVFCFDLNIILYHYSCEKGREKWINFCSPFWADEEIVFDFLSEPAKKKVISSYIKKIVNRHVQVVGFSIYVSTLFASLFIARLIKARLPQIKIIFGGPYFNIDAPRRAFSLLKNNGPVDAVVVGEGEVTLSDLLSIIEQQGKIDFCPGTIIKKNGEVLDCGRRDEISNLDALPFLDYSYFPLSYYSYRNRMGAIFYSHRLTSKGLIKITTSRGCINSCSFCLVWKYNGRYRSMGGERVFFEIIHQRKMLGAERTQFFELADALTDIGMISVFSDLVIAHSLDISWSCQTVISSKINMILLERMKKAGCMWITYGIESGSQNILNKMRKPFKISLVERVIRDTSRAGIYVRVNLIVGFPSETGKDFNETLTFLEKNRECITMLNAWMYSLAEGSEIFEERQKYGILYPGGHESIIWETKDGQNSLLERLNRLEKLYKCVQDFRSESDKPAPLFQGEFNKIDMLRVKNYYTGVYYSLKQERQKALRYFLISLKEEPYEDMIMHIFKRLKLLDMAK